MADIETLTLEFRAKTADAQAQVAALDKKVDGFAASAQKMSAKVSSALGNMAKGLAIGAVVAFGAALVAATKKSLDLADGLKDVSDITGASTDALQAWRHGAELNAASADTFDASLKKLVKSVGEARSGNAAMAESFRKLGMEDLIKNGAKTEEIVNALANAMRSIKDPAVAAALATDVMGKQAIELVPLLSQGEAGLRAYGKALKDAGGHQSAEMVRELAALADETKEVTKAFEKLAADVAMFMMKAALGVKLAVEWMAVQLQRLAVLTTQGLRGVAEFDNKRIMDAGAANERRHSRAKHGNRTPFVPVTVDTGNGGGGGGGSGRNEAAEAIKREQAAIKDLIRDLEFEHSIIGQTAEQTAVMNNLRQLGASATEEQRVQVEAWTRRNFEAAEAIRKVAELEAFAKDIREQYGDGTEQAAEAQEKLNRALAAGLINLAEYDAALEDLSKDPKLEELKKKWQEIGDQIEDNLAGAFTDMAFEADKANEIVAELIESIGRLIAKQLFLQAIQAATGSIFGDGGIGGALSGVVGGFAAGGTLNPGNAYQLHKNEVLVPRVPMSVIPAGRGARGSSFTYAPQFNVAPGVTKQELLMALKQHDDHVKRSIVPMVRDANQRGALKMA